MEDESGCLGCVSRRGNWGTCDPSLREVQTQNFSSSWGLGGCTCHVAGAQAQPDPRLSWQYWGEKDGQMCLHREASASEGRLAARDSPSFFCLLLPEAPLQVRSEHFSSNSPREEGEAPLAAVPGTPWALQKSVFKEINLVSLQRHCLWPGCILQRWPQ